MTFDKGFNTVSGIYVQLLDITENYLQITRELKEILRKNLQ